MKNQKTAFIFLLLAAVFWSRSALSDFTPVIDGDISEWPTDGSSFFIFEDERDMSPLLSHRDIVKVWVTDDNTLGSNGNLYLAIEMRSAFLRTFWNFEIGVWLQLDLTGDGNADILIDLVNGLPSTGQFANRGRYLEAAIPYSELGLVHGSDIFGLSIFTTGILPETDYAPNQEYGFITYDGTAGDDVEPLSVRMLSLQASVFQGGVRVLWQTGSERSNAGFNVYKLTGNKQTLLTRTLIPGLGDSGFGRWYEFIDERGKKGDQYLIEDVAFCGKGKRHKPVSADLGNWMSSNFSTWTGHSSLANHKKTSSLKERLIAFFESLSKSPRPKNINSGVKIEVSENNFHYISYEDLVSSGLSQRVIKTKRFSLKKNGEDIPLIFGKEGVYFLGTFSTTRYTDYQVYIAGQGRPTIMKSGLVSSGQNCPDKVSTYTATKTVEENTIYNVASPNDPFFHAAAYAGHPGQVEFYFDEYKNGNVSMNVTLAGFATNPKGYDHMIEISLNGHVLDEFSWNGKERFTAEVFVPETVINNSLNELAFSILNEEIPNVVWLDKVELNYELPLALSEYDKIEFDLYENSCVEILLNGQKVFSLLDITDVKNPIRLHGYNVDAENQVLTFNYPNHQRGTNKGQKRKLILTTKASLAQVEGIIDLNSNIISKKSKAEYLIITHPAFVEAATELAEYRNAQGITSLVVSTDDIYDEYNFGMPHPNAIKAMIKDAASKWENKLSHVLLLGAATVDPLGYLGLGKKDFVPAYFHAIDRFNYEAASDWLYVKDIPFVSIGRLPVSSSKEAFLMVSKIKVYEEQVPSGKGICIADADKDNLSFGQGQFEKKCENQTRIQDSFNWTKIYKNFEINALGVLKESLQTADVVNYHGHAYLSGWSSSPQLANISFAHSLENKHLFLLLSWSCFDGAFTGPWDESLAWAFVKNPQGGAIAAIAASSLSNPEAASKMAEEISWLLASIQGITLGEALSSAKINLQNTTIPGINDVIATFNLIGDPLNSIF